VPSCLLSDFAGYFAAVTNVLMPETTGGLALLLEGIEQSENKKQL